MKSNSNNIEEFYNEIRGKYSSISLEDTDKICRGPFKFIKEVISSGELKDIRLEYFGVFEVSKRRLNFKKKSLQESYENGTVSQAVYDKRMKILNSYES